MRAGSIREIREHSMDYSLYRLHFYNRNYSFNKRSFWTIGHFAASHRMDHADINEN